jgi:hypothetical protein
MGGASLSARREAKRTKGASLIGAQEAQLEARDAPMELREVLVASCEAPRKAWEALGSFGEDSFGVSRDAKRVERANENLERARKGCGEDRNRGREAPEVTRG